MKTMTATTPAVIVIVLIVRSIALCMEGRRWFKRSIARSALFLTDGDIPNSFHRTC